VADFILFSFTTHAPILLTITSSTGTHIQKKRIHRLWITRCTCNKAYSLSMALQSFVEPWPLFQFLILYTAGRTPWTGVSPSQGRYLNTEQHKHRINAHRYPCLELDSNQRPQCSSKRRRFMSQTARPLWSAQQSLLLKKSFAVNIYLGVNTHPILIL
jgi:hypothetical protein